MENSGTPEPEGAEIVWDLEKGPVNLNTELEVEEQYFDQQQQSSEQQDAGDAATLETQDEITKRLLGDVMKRLDSLNEPVTYTWHKISCFVPVHNKKWKFRSCKKNINPRVEPTPSNSEPKKQILHEGKCLCGFNFTLVTATA